MRFVFLSYNYSPDIHSPEEWVDRLKFYVGSLEQLSKQHTVIRVDQINYEGHFIHNGVEYYCVNDGKKKNYFPRKLHRFVKTLQPDVIVVSSFLFPLQVIQLRKYLGKKVKIIIQNHADKPFTGFKKYLQRWADNSIDGYIFASCAMGADWVRRGNIGSEKKIHEIVGGSSLFYPVDKLKAKAETKTEGDPVFLWVGRLNENKDPLTVVKGFLEFVKEHPSAKLYMIYQTTELLNAITRLKEENANGQAISLVGKINHAALLYWFNSADFYISGSHYEGSGTALGEAMSCGCIPVVTDIFSFRFITNNGNCGLLYEAGNEVALVSALQKAMQLDREKQRKKSLDHFNTALSFEAIAHKFQLLAASL
jgi:glycosyltransferase involved in cell wall biosynthesis